MVVNTTLNNILKVSWLLILFVTGCREHEGNPAKVKTTIKKPLNDLIPVGVYHENHINTALFLPTVFQNAKSICSITNPGNFCDSVKSFNIKQGRMVYIYSVGELNNSLIDSNGVNYIPFDRIEIYNYKGKNPGKNFTKDGNQEFIFSYGMPNYDGINTGLENIEFKQNDPSAKSYFLEVALPWKNLNSKPFVGQSINCNIRIVDNDYPDEKVGIEYKYRPKLVNLFGKNLNLFASIKRGKLLLCPKSVNSIVPDIITSQFVVNSPKIDGFQDRLWEQICPYDISSIVKGRLRGGQKDFCATVQSCWDFANIYFLFKIDDDWKGTFNGLMDYGWIEDFKGHVIWMMNTVASQHAGGALKNQKIISKVYLKKGRYKLRYITDESHAYRNWNDAPPTTSFYGIKLY